MNRFVVALGLVSSALASARAQVAPVKAGVYPWASVRGVDVGRGRVERVILVGSTLDLDSLEVRAVTLPAAAATGQRSSAHDSLETFMMVKEGKLWVTLERREPSAGRGERRARAARATASSSRTIGGTPATYYLFTYRSKAPMDLNARQAGGRLVHGRLRTTVARSPRASGSAARHAQSADGDVQAVRDRTVSSVNEGLRNHQTHTHRADEFMMMTRGNVAVLIGTAGATPRQRATSSSSAR